MKKLSVYISVLVLGLLSVNIASAQRRGNHHRPVEHYRPAQRHERVSYRYYRDVRDHHYDRRQEIVYSRPVVRVEHYHARNAWYYNRGYQRHSGYVYFPQYHTYYDPYRVGYVYMERNAWIFAPTVPSFMAGLNLGGLSVQFFSRLPI